jgi:mono/diheme cytochrome c family protein
MQFGGTGEGGRAHVFHRKSTFWALTHTLGPLIASNFFTPISTRSDMKTSRLALALCSLFFILTAAFAQTPPDTTLIANPVYKKDCAKCHGKTAEGRHFGGPSLVSEKTTAAPAAELRNVITNGKGHMPKYAGKLTSEEIDTLVQQINATSKK